MRIFRTVAVASGVSLLVLAQAAQAQARTEAPAATTEPGEQQPVAGGADAPGGDIVVTARRRQENIQSVPVSVTALGGESLVRLGITETEDLQRVVPGVVFAGSGSGTNTIFTIRGQGKDVVGPGLPSVISYLNEIPLPAQGSSLPAYDIENVQILKGPQGTLFGRNTTGGAVLVYTRKPDWTINGFGETTFGNYDWTGVQAGLNIPIVPDVLAIRVAGEVVRRDGYTRIVNLGIDQNNISTRSGRISIRFEPASGIRNDTVLDYLRSSNNYAGVVPLSTTPFRPGSLNALFASAFDCNVSVSCDLDLQIARQRELGPRRVFSDVRPFSKLTNWGVSNTTTIEIGSVTLKNIFGYRRVSNNEAANTDGVDLALFNSESFRNEDQLTDEIQLSGTLFDDRFEYLLGGFYLRMRPTGVIGLLGDALRPATIPQQFWPNATFSNNLYTDDSRAIFGNFGYRFGGALDGLRLNAGVRHTWDKPGVCARTYPAGSQIRFTSFGQCQATPGTFNPDPVTFRELTWTVGVDYRLNDNVFAYGTTRRGYRAGAFNTPTLGGTLRDFQFYGPQTIDDFEIGLRTNWNSGGVSGRFNITAFTGTFKRVQRQITALPQNFDGDNDPTTDPSNTTIVVNSGRTRVRGIEFDAALSPARGLNFTAAGAYLDAQFTDLQVPPLFAGLPGAVPTFNQTPEWSYSVSARYELPVDIGGPTVAIGADYYWTDDYTVGLVTVPDYGLANAQVEIGNLGKEGLTLTGFVNNLFDKAYLRNNSLTGASPGVFSFGFGEPRMYGLRLRYTF